MSGVERERKFAGWVGFELPPLDGIDDGVLAVPMPEQQLEATYYDTEDLRLARSGVTVRFRTGEEQPTWTVKLPSGDDGPALVRREIDIPGTARTIPDEVTSLVRAQVRSALLAPVGSLHTRRRRVQLRRRGVVGAYVQEPLQIRDYRIEGALLMVGRTMIDDLRIRLSRQLRCKRLHEP